MVHTISCGGVRYDCDSDIIMWNTLIPHMPTEIVTLIGMYCDRTTLKALRCANHSCEYATQPVFNTFFKHVTLRHNVGEVSSSVRNLLELSRDEVKCPLVNKITLYIESSLSLDASQKPWFDDLDHGHFLDNEVAQPWRDRLNSREEQRLVELEVFTLLGEAFENLSNWVELEIYAPTCTTNDAEIILLGSLVFSYGVWFILKRAVTASRSLRSVTTACEDDWSAVRLLASGEPGWTTVLPCVRLTSVDLRIYAYYDDADWAPFFEAIAPVKQLSLTIGPLQQDLDQGCDMCLFTDQMLMGVKPTLQLFKRLIGLHLDVAACRMQILCSFVEKVYSRLSTLSISVYTPHMSGITYIGNVGLERLSHLPSKLEYFKLSVQTSCFKVHPWYSDFDQQYTEWFHADCTFTDEESRQTFLAQLSAELITHVDKLRQDGSEIEHQHVF